MNYTNYELHIIKHYGAALIGWPVSGHVRNPSKIGGRQEVEKLLNALESEMCKWVKLTQEQLVAQAAQNKAWQAAGEKVYHPQHVCGSNSGASKNTVDTEEENDEDDEDEDDENEK